MRTFFYFELFHQAQDHEVLSLMKFPPAAILPADYSLSAKVISCGRSKSRKIKQLEVLRAELSDSTFNSIEFISKFVPYSLANTCFQVLSITRTLDISPTNSLWAATRDWPEQRSLLVNREYHTLGSAEDSLSYHGVTTYPTCLATNIEFGSANLKHLEIDAIHHMLFDILKSSLPEVLVDGNVVGGGGIEIYEPEINTSLVSVARTDNALRRSPKSYNWLGERFGTLQPLMFGSFNFCEEIANGIEEGCEIAKVSSESAHSQGLLHIKQEALSNPQSLIKSEPWLVPR